MRKRMLALAGLVVALAAAPSAQASFGPGPVDFGTTSVPVTLSVPWAIGHPVTITSVDLGGYASDGPFFFTGESCAGKQVSAGCTQQITFDPTTVAPGVYHTTYNLLYQDGATTGTDSIDLIGVADGSSHIDVPSQSGAGVRADASSAAPVMSANGRFVAFASVADNLVPGFGPAPSSGAFDHDEAYLRDRVAGTTIAISVDMGGSPADHGAVPWAVSGDGRYVLFAAQATGLVEQTIDPSAVELYLRDTQSGTTTLVSSNAQGIPADALGAQYGDMSDDGSVVCFDAQSDNLVPQEDPNVNEVLCKDLNSGKVSRADAAVNGGAPTFGIDVGSTQVSADGRFVVFSSRSGNLVKHDTNRWLDVFLHDRATGRTRRVNVTAGGGVLDGSGLPAINAAGTRVAFQHDNTWYVKSLVTGALVRVARSGGSDFPASLSPTGRHLAYTRLVSGVEQLYLRDLKTGSTRLISRAAAGQVGNGHSFAPSAGSGRRVTFASLATNLKLVPATGGAQIMTWSP